MNKNTPLDDVSRIAEENGDDSGKIVDGFINRKTLNDVEAAAIDRLTEQLFLEFEKHNKEVQETNPTYTDRHELFLCWAMQRISALTYTVLRLANQVNDLEHARRSDMSH